MPIDQLQFTNPQAYSGGADFSPLAKLYDVYKESQQRAMQEQALGQLGDDPIANRQALTASGVLPLAKLGIGMQDTEIARRREDIDAAQKQQNFMLQQKLREQEAARSGGYLTIAQQQEAARARKEAEDTPEGRRAKLIAAGMNPDDPNFAAHIATNAALPTPIALEVEKRAQATFAEEQKYNTIEKRKQAVIDGELDRNDPEIRRWVGLGGKLPDSVRTNEWNYHFNAETGQVIATSKTDPSKTKDVTPGAVAGQPAMSKQEREVAGYVAAGKAQGLTDEQAQAYALNKGKMPSENLSATEVKILAENQKAITSGGTVLDTVNRMKDLSPEAWSGMGAEKRAALVSAILPSAFIPPGATNAEELGNLALQNVAGQAKAMFGARLALGEVQLLQKIETTPNMSRASRERIYPQVERIISNHMRAAEAENEAIRNKTYKKAGGSPTIIHPDTSTTAAKTKGVPAPKPGAPTLADFMTRARAANPKASERELSDYWKTEYGSQ